MRYFPTSNAFNIQDFPINADLKAPKLLIYNSPGNLKFVARYVGCTMGSGRYCYFQDDDWIVAHLRSLYANFLRSPHLLHTDTNNYVYPLTNWQWTFVNPGLSLVLL